MDDDTVTCQRCAAEGSRDVAFPCFHDRRGHVYLGPDRPRLQRWVSAFVCPECAAHLASPPQEEDPAAARERRILSMLYEAGRRVLP